MEKKPEYNDDKIGKAVDSLNDCIKKIKDELSPDKYKDLISNLEDTVTTLNETDNLMVVKKEIQNQIIFPVNKQIEKTRKINFRFGWIGIIAAVIGIATAILFSYFTSGHILRLDSNLDEVKEQINKNFETDFIIYKKNIGLIEKQIHSNIQENKKILEKIDKNADILTELKEKHEYKYTDDQWIGFGANPNLIDIFKIPGSITDPNSLFTIPETKNED